MEKEKSNPYTFFILRYRLVNLQGGILRLKRRIIMAGERTEKQRV